MSTPRDLDVSDALADLVDQFADPLVFLRELVQNSLDAGSPEVDVYTEFRASPEDPARGVMVIGVDDYGAGMDRHIIDTQLTRLFSSNKDGDLTKIGKFGIGFVSVFSLRPDAVCVDTSRGGEHWRILFRGDRSFVRIAREHPVDGTKVQVIKAGTREEHAGIARRAEATLRYWCKHVAGTVRWHDEDIAEPFDLAGALCRVRHEEDGLRVVVGYLPDGVATHGFYNRGLTLLEGRGASLLPELPDVAFKVDSRRLEHTLARNDVMRDESFDRVMELVRGLAGAGLDEALVRVVGERLRAGEGPAALDAAYRVLARVIRRRGVPPTAPLVRALDGTELGAGSLRKAAKAGSLWVIAGDEPGGSTKTASPLVRAAVAAGHTVIPRPEGGAGLDVLLQAVVEREVLDATRALVRPEPLDAAQAEAWAPLVAAVRALVPAGGVTVADVAMARLRSAGSPVAGRLFVLLPAADALVPYAPELVRPLAEWKRSHVLVLDVEHTSLRPLPALARREPELAAYTLLKLVCLETGALPVELDSRLCTASTALRAARLERAS